MKKIIVPQESVNDDDVTVVTIKVTEKQKVSEGDILAEIETSKAIVDIESSVNGFVHVKCKEGDDIPVGSVMFEVYESEDFIAKTEDIESENSVSETEYYEKVVNDESNSESKLFSDIGEPETILESNHNLKFKTKFSKNAEKLIKEHNINKSEFNSQQFVNSKKINDFLGYNDVIKAVKPKKNDTLIDDSMSLKKLSKAKINEINYLSDVNSTGLVSQLGIDVKATMDGIKNAQNFIESTPLPTIIHETSRLLKTHSNLNSFYENNNIILYNNINIGVAFDDNINGLKVGTIDNANKLNLKSIENSITDLSIKYQENKLSVKEITNHTITISDLFSTDITAFKPLVNSKNSIILGIASLQKNSFRIECSFDHRISSGLEISYFLKELKNRLESRFLESKKYNFTISENDSCVKCLREPQDDLDGEIYFTSVYNSKLKGNICSICLNGF